MIRRHSAAGSVKRRDRSMAVQLPTPIPITPTDDSTLRPTAAEVTLRGGERLRSRAGRGLLLVEGLAIGVLGGVALAWSMGFTRFGADGMPMLRGFS